MNKIFRIILLLLYASTLQAQSTGFQTKIKKDTFIDVSQINAKEIKGFSSSDLSNNDNTTYPSSLFVKPALKGKSNLSIDPSSNTSVKVTRQSMNGLPRAIEFKRNTSNNGKGKITRETRSKHFLNELAPYLNVSGKSDFKVYEDDDLRTKLKQTYKGIDFYGKEIVLHFNEEGQGTFFTGVYSPGDFELDIAPGISTNDALDIVLDNLKNKTKITELSDNEKEFYHYTGPASRKVVFESVDQKKYFLAYEIELKPNVLETWKYIIDADNGTVLQAYSILCSVDGAHTATAVDLNGISRSINTYLEGSKYKMTNTTKSMYNSTTKEGKIITLNAQNTPGTQYTEITSSNNTWNIPAAVSAHYNAGVAYDYFNVKHGRNSINGQGGTITSFVNVSDDNGLGMDNAYWNGQAIFYGNGRTDFFPLAKSLDVAGHEMTHGVVQNTANLEYYDESGAINESMADIFGFMMDSTDWLIGEEVVKPAVFPSGALRNLQNPHNGGTSLSHPGYQPMHVSEQYLGSSDNRGVHINSGIPNHAFYLLATSLSKTKASNIFYRALSKYLTRYSVFIDLRIACVQSAKDLFGASAPEVLKTEQAFDGVGIVGGNTTTVSTTLPINPGQDYLLTLDTYLPKTTLYHSTIYGTSYRQLSQTEIVSRPSITDDGTLAAYVGGDHKIYLLNITDFTNPIEQVFDNQPIWSNVALSKDGKRLAAVTMDVDTSIYIYSITKDKKAKFHLYNPTFTDGVKAAGPLYADALEWDYTGELLIYDAFNSIKNISGTNDEYWDVNFIKVWNNDLNFFGDGKVQKLFSNLPEGVSIGNPSFSKNSPYIIAFDYSDEIGDAILGIDIENNKQELIAENNTLGWPSYSKLDNKLAITTLVNDQDGIHQVVGVINLNADKISATSLNVTYITNFARCGVYYTKGSRSLIISADEDVVVQEDSELLAYPNPFENYISFKSTKKYIKEITIYDSKGILVQSKSVDTKEETINTIDLPQGIYLIMVLVDGNYQSFKMIKQ
jgi:Zn-dependent metalloprotease